jgi:hypothetical protein
VPDSGIPSRQIASAKMYWDFRLVLSRDWIDQSDSICTTSGSETVGNTFKPRLIFKSTHCFRCLAVHHDQTRGGKNHLPRRAGFDGLEKQGQVVAKIELSLRTKDAVLTTHFVPRFFASSLHEQSIISDYSSKSRWVTMRKNLRFTRHPVRARPLHTIKQDFSKPALESRDPE